MHHLLRRLLKLRRRQGEPPTYETEPSIPSITSISEPTTTQNIGTTCYGGFIQVSDRYVLNFNAIIDVVDIFNGKSDWEVINTNIFENSDFIYMLNQASGDRQIPAKQLNISPHQLSYVTHSGKGEGLLFYGNVILPFADKFPRDTEFYRIMTNKPGEATR